MKRHTDVTRRDSGSVLVITLVLASILGITLTSYLYWVRTQNLLVAQSQSWNSALALAEAGIEEGMAQINVMSGTDYASSYQPSATTNFGPLSGGVYGPRTNALNYGSYGVIIAPPAAGTLSLGPTITSTGYTKLPILSKPVARVVQVTTSIKPLFANGITSVSNITLKGSGLTIDSYDSKDPAHSTNGFYYAPTRKAGGDVGSIYGPVDLQNATVAGHLQTGPNTPYSLNNGIVGDLNWTGPGVQPGWWLNDFNMDIPDVIPPFTSGFTSLPAGTGTNTWLVPGGMYYIDSDFTINNNQTLYVSGNASIYVTGNFTMRNNSGSIISIAPGATLKLYVGAPSGTAVSANLATVNTSGVDDTFQFYGLPTCKNMSWNGNAAFLGIVYAPQAYFKLGGGGSNPYDFQGSVTVQTIEMNGHFNVHYDENLKRLGPASGFTVASWRELAPAQ
jgi:hypothetical protein